MKFLTNNLTVNLQLDNGKEDEEGLYWELVANDKTIRPFIEIFLGSIKEHFMTEYLAEEVISCLVHEYVHFCLSIIGYEDVGESFNYFEDAEDAVCLLTPSMMDFSWRVLEMVTERGKND